MSDPLLQWRSEFPIVERTNYMISNSLGAMPTRSRKSMERYIDLWDDRGVRAWGDEWWNLQFTFGDLVADLIGVDHGTVSMHQNVAMASQTILSCFDVTGERNKIVYSDLNFPSVMYLYEEQRRRGAEIVRVPASADGLGVDLEQLLEAIDEKTAIVPVSHVLFRSGFIQNAKAIVDRANEVGAFVILDVYQSIGALPLKLKEWGVHAAVGGVLKYCCGGPGNSFLYVSPEKQKELVPTFTGWAAHKDPFAFSAEGQDFREDGGRYLNGTPNVPALYAGIEGSKIILEIGLEAIRAKSERMSTMLIERCDHHGLPIRSPRDVTMRGNHVSIDAPNGYEVCQVLNNNDIVCDYRPMAGIRLSPHFYNTEEEVIAAVDAIADCVSSGAWQEYAGQARKPG